MKKKIALLLAGAMTLSSLPVNVFANVNSNRAESGLSSSAIAVSSNTALVEAGDRLQGVASGDVNNHDDVDFWARGMNFEVQLPVGLPEGSQFQVQLRNAEWFFDGGELGGTAPRVLENSRDWDNTTRTLTRTAEQSGPNGVGYRLTVDPTKTVATVTITEATTEGSATSPTAAINAVRAAQELLPVSTLSAGETLIQRTETAVNLTGDLISDIETTLRTEIEDFQDAAEIVRNGGHFEVETDATHIKDANGDFREARRQPGTHLPTEAPGNDGTHDVDGTVSTTFVLNDNYPQDGTHNLVENSSTGTHVVDETVNTTFVIAPMEEATHILDVTTAVDNLTQEAEELLGKLENLLDDVDTSTTPEKRRVSIPLVTRTTTTGEDAAARLLSAGGFNVQQDWRAFAISTAEGSTITRIADPQTSRNALDISPIAISENRVGALPATGAFEIVAPSGYSFARVSNVTPELRTSGGINGGVIATWSNDRGTDRADNTIRFTNSNNNVIRVEYSGLQPSTGVTGGLGLTGFELVPNNVDNVSEGDVYLNIRNVRTTGVTQDTITAQRFLAGTIADWDVNLSVIGGDNVPELINGRLDGVERTNVADDTHKAATVRFEESIADAWWANRTTTFTLPEGVRVRKLEFDRVRNIENDEALEGTFYNDRNRNNGNVRINDNVITLTNLRTNGRASFDMNLWLNIESGFTGDIELTVGGSAVTGNNRDEDQSVVIATAINPIRVEAETTNVRVGYQFVPVGNFRIIENVAGALIADEQVFISVTDDIFTDMHIANGYDWEITAGDLQVRNVRTGTNLSLNNNNRNNDVNVSFEVSRESTRPSTIEFTNVQVRMNNNAPISNQDAGYDLVVWGPAVAANFDGVRPENASGVTIDGTRSDEFINSNDFFRTAGIRTNYINVGSSAGFGTNVVRVTEGSNVIVVGDQEMTMDTAAYVSPASDSMMVPVRFVSQALGIPERNVIWNPETSEVTIRAAETTLQFQTNSSTMRINGIAYPILNANGEPVQSEVRDERAFIPFRALGEALNIFVDWDAETSTAIFDPNQQPQSSLFAA